MAAVSGGVPRETVAQPARGTTPARDPPPSQVVIAAPGRGDESLLDTPRAVSVDSTEAARSALARDVGERLDELPGVFVQRTTSASAAPLLRGLGGQRVLLLFDGLRLNDSLTKVGGNALLTLVDPSIVRQVEVVRGPASVLYGSDALGGMVLVTPLDASPRPLGAFGWRAEATLRGASAERSVQGGGFIEGELGLVGLLLGGSLGDTGQLTAGSDLGVQRFTGYGDRAVSVRAMLRPTDTQRLGVAFHTSALTDAPRPDLSVPTDQRSFRLQQRDLGYLQWRAIIAGLLLVARAGVMVRTEYRDRLRDTRLDVERDQVTTWLASLQLDRRVRGARFTVGAEASLDSVESATTTTRGAARPEVSRGRYVEGSGYLTSGAYAFWQQRLGPRLLSEAGVRLAFVRATAPMDGAIAPMDQARLAPVASIGLRFLAVEGLGLVANVLSGFRAPNLDDYQALGSGARSFDVPNPGLGPERSLTVEVGARVVRGGWSGSFFVFGARLEGLVVRVPSSYQGMTTVDGRRVYTRANASEGSMVGAELDLAWRSRLGFFASLAASYSQGDNTFPGDAGQAVTEPMAKVPPALGRVSTGWRGERGWAELVLAGGLPQPRLAVSDREDPRLCPAGPAMCTQAAGWASLTVRGGVALTRWATLGAAVENVWDGAFTPYGAGAPAPGINVLGMLRLRSR